MKRVKLSESEVEERSAENEDSLLGYDSDGIDVVSVEIYLLDLFPAPCSITARLSLNLIKLVWFIRL